MRFCCVSGCYENQKPVSLVKIKRSFHKFPLQNKDLTNKWIEAIRRDNFKPSATSLVCSDHFKKSDFHRSHAKRQVLKPNAVPSVFNFPQQPPEALTIRQIIWNNMQRDAVPRHSAVKPPPKAVSPQYAIADHNYILSGSSTKIQCVTALLEKARTKLKEKRAQIKQLKKRNSTKMRKIFNLKSQILQLKKEEKN